MDFVGLTISILESLKSIAGSWGLAIVLLTIATFAWPYIYHSADMMWLCWLIFGLFCVVVFSFSDYD